MTDEAISPLRRRMIEDMTIRKFASKTPQDYVQRVKNFAAFLGRSPVLETRQLVRRYQLHLAASGAGVPTLKQSVATLRFLFRSLTSSNVFAPRKVKIAALRSCDEMRTEAPVGARPSRIVHWLDTRSRARRAKIASARASVPSFASSATSIPRRAIVTAALTAPPPGWVETSSASVLRPSSSSKKELSAFSMVMRSIRTLSMIAIVSIMAPPTVRIFIHVLCKKDVPSA